MPKKCQLSGKCAKSGNKVSHSKIKSKRQFKANLQTKTIVNPADGQKMRVTLSTKAIKTLKKWMAQGKKFDLRKMI